MNKDDILSRYRQNDGETACSIITPKLVKGQELSDEQKEMVASLDELLKSSSPCEREMVVYRGCRLDEFRDGEPYRAFISTSLEIFEALRFCQGCLVKIVVPKGTQILKVSPERSETSSLERGEYLLTRGLRFKIKSWSLSEEEILHVGFCSYDGVTFNELVIP